MNGWFVTNDTNGSLAVVLGWWDAMSVWMTDFERLDFA